MLTVEQIAEVAHNVNKAIDDNFGGEMKQVAWCDTPDNIRNSTISGVVAHISNPGMSPEDSHNKWLAEKVGDGWKYGETRNVETKEHPCMAPWCDLKAEWKVKDHAFKAVVQSLAAYVESPATDAAVV